jgi:serine/threonine-protein kinase
MSDDADDDVKAASRRLGQTLGGKWRLDKLLGMGGMAAVYSATHKNNLKNVAVKVLHAELQRNEAVRTRFLREGYVANKVGHPGAVSAIDDGIDESGAVFLVMELLHGQSLAQRVDGEGGKLGQREVLRITEGILDVLASAHAQNVVHRDLKPDNVFLVPSNGTTTGAATEVTVKVLDFGVARVLDTGEAKTRTGVVMGTPEYMPPEQARGRSEHIDGRSDLWATASMMFRLLTGHYVHEAETQNEVLLLAMTEPARKVADVAPSVHPKVAALMDRALAYEPMDRFPDAEAMRAAVKEALATLDEQDSKQTLVPVKGSPLEQGAEEDDVDDAAATIPVSDFLKAKPPPAKTSAPLDESPKPSLWVHTKATPPEPPKAPKKKRKLLPILAASAVLAMLCVGIAYGIPRMRGDARPGASTPDASSGAVPVAEDTDADADAGDDEIEIDDEDASPGATTTSSVRPSAPHVAPTSKPKTKKKKHH